MPSEAGTGSTGGVAASAPRRRPGWMAVARKEFADHVNSVRLTIVIGLLALSAIAAVYAAAGQIRDVASQATGDPSLFLRLFVLEFGDTAFDFTFFTFVSLVGPLLGIVFGFDAVNSERSERTLPRLVAQPIYRDDVINGKFVAGLSVIALVLTGLTAVVAGVGIVRLGIVPTPVDVARLLSWLVLSIVYVGFWLAFALLCSVLLRRAATSALTAIGVWIVASLFATFIVQIVADTFAPVPEQPTAQEALANVRLRQTLGRLSPGFLYEEAASAILTPEIRTLGFSLSLLDPRAVPSRLSLTQSLSIVWPQTVALVALTIGAFAIAYVVFMREEIRA